ncbi:MAG: hypothetical protein EB078_10500 [Proteobacteria bacterium]|nr:hypothetical protein [Pseudomonadota bacterium]NDG26614.1 hypothetical protein [Pseudomonadota bacterium]
MTLAEFKKLLLFARKNKLVKIKCGDFEAELSPQSWLNRKEQKAFENLLSPDFKQPVNDEDLFWSAK